MKTTKEEIAARLHGVEYGNEDADKQIIADARESNLLIISGASDDLCELRGAFRNEAGCYGGGDVFFTASGNLPDMAQVNEAVVVLEEELGLKVKLPGLLKIEAIWGQAAPDGRTPSWHYKTTIPHATFDVMEDGELYCIGLVIDLSEQPTAEEAP